MNYETFVSDLIRPLVLHEDEVLVSVSEHDGNNYQIQVSVNADDLGRVIGRKGRIANSIRTIVHACAARNGDYIDIAINEK